MLKVDRKCPPPAADPCLGSRPGPASRNAAQRYAFARDAAAGSICAQGQEATNSGGDSAPTAPSMSPSCHLPYHLRAPHTPHAAHTCAHTQTHTKCTHAHPQGRDVRMRIHKDEMYACASTRTRCTHAHPQGRDVRMRIHKDKMYACASTRTRCTHAHPQGQDVRMRIHKDRQPSGGVPAIALAAPPPC
eukprot:353513-Chlamydomonas_euryale.AAC.3